MQLAFVLVCAVLAAAAAPIAEAQTTPEVNTVCMSAALYSDSACNQELFSFSKVPEMCGRCHKPGAAGGSVLLACYATSNRVRFEDFRDGACKEHAGLESMSCQFSCSAPSTCAHTPDPDTHLVFSPFALLRPTGPADGSCVVFTNGNGRSYRVTRHNSAAECETNDAISATTSTVLIALCALLSLLFSRMQ
jgi:hypothetical protein